MLRGSKSTKELRVESSGQMTVSLRPHHLLCILTHVGKGYSPAFTDNLAAIIQRIANGEEVEIVDGPDDVCAPLLGKRIVHCHRKRVAARDHAASNEIGKILSIRVRPGQRIVLHADSIRSLRREFAAKRVRSACEGCRWSSLCTSVASAGFSGTRPLVQLE